MALAIGYTEYDVSVNGRQTVYIDRLPLEKSRNDKVVEFYVSSDLDLGDGALLVQASVQETPAEETDAHWHTLEGLEDLVVGKVYRVALRAPALSILTSGATGTPVGTVVVG